MSDTAERTTSFEITGWRGRCLAEAGDTFRWHDGSTWQIEEFKGPMGYSPSGLGGTPIVVCRHIAGEIGPQFAEHTVDGLCEWCGDSVASALIESGKAALISAGQ